MIYCLTFSMLHVTFKKKKTFKAMKRQKCNLEHKAYPPCFWEQFGNPPYHSAWTIIAYRSSQKQPPKMFYKKAVLKNIAKFTRKQLHHIFFCNQIAGLSPINLQEICKFTANFLQVQVNFELFFFNYFVEQLRTAASVDLCLQFCLFSINPEHQRLIKIACFVLILSISRVT